MHAYARAVVCSLAGVGSLVLAPTCYCIGPDWYVGVPSGSERIVFDAGCVSPVDEDGGRAPYIIEGLTCSNWDPPSNCPAFCCDCPGFAEAFALGVCAMGNCVVSRPEDCEKIATDYGLCPPFDGGT